MGREWQAPPPPHSSGIPGWLPWEQKAPKHSPVLPPCVLSRHCTQGACLSQPFQGLPWQMYITNLHGPLGPALSSCSALTWARELLGTSSNPNKRASKGGRTVVSDQPTRSLVLEVPLCGEKDGRRSPRRCSHVLLGLQSLPPPRPPPSGLQAVSDHTHSACRERTAGRGPAWLSVRCSRRSVWRGQSTAPSGLSWDPSAPLGLVVVRHLPRLSPFRSFPRVGIPFSTLVLYATLPNTLS